MKTLAESSAAKRISVNIEFGNWFQSHRAHSESMKYDIRPDEVSFPTSDIPCAREVDLRSECISRNRGPVQRAKYGILLSEMAL